MDGNWIDDYKIEVAGTPCEAVIDTGKVVHIPDRLLELFEKTAWPLPTVGNATRSAGQGPRVDVGARMRGMWR